ncbi:MAG: hypothetical protein IIB27_07165, partial [Chloroflexi bacterium]|nr:hypothetical protein [Chloroflexota bacterium]
MLLPRFDEYRSVRTGITGVGLGSARRTHVNLTAGAPGKLVDIGEGAFAFIPDPLPPAIEADWELAELIGEANRALGAVEAVGGRLANPDLVAAPLLNREAVLSSRIEGTVTSLEQLALFEASPEDAPSPLDARVVRNYVVAVRYGLERLQNLPVSLRLIREVHERLFDGVGGQVPLPGEFRLGQNYIGSRAPGIESARFVPPPPAQGLPALQ